MTAAQEHTHTWEVIGQGVDHSRTSNEGYDLLWCRSCDHYGRRGPTYFACGIRPARTGAQVQQMRTEAHTKARAIVEAHKARHQMLTPEEAASDPN